MTAVAQPASKPKQIVVAFVGPKTSADEDTLLALLGFKPHQADIRVYDTAESLIGDMGNSKASDTSVDIIVYACNTSPNMKSTPSLREQVGAKALMYLTQRGPALFVFTLGNVAYIQLTSQVSPHDIFPLFQGAVTLGHWPEELLGTP